MTVIKPVELRSFEKTTSQSKKYPVCLTIAGSDPSGGAGIEADLKTFAAHGVYGATCITGLTCQNTSKVESIDNTPKDHLKNTLKLIFEDFLEPENDTSLLVIKTGMMTEESIDVLNGYLDYLKERKVKLIVDPVMVSTSGYDFLPKNLIVESTYLSILQQSYLVTPNFVEAVSLAAVGKTTPEKPKIRNIDDFIEFTIDLQKQLSSKNILVKGGHIPFNVDGEAVDTKEIKLNHSIDLLVKDVLYQSETDTVTVFTSKFVHTKNSHGTGCTLSSSIAANIAQGKYTLDEAVALSIDFIHLGLDSMQKLGHGNGPLNHLVVPETVPYKVLKCDTPAKEYTDYIFSNYGTFHKYFISHPKISKIWKNYVNHPFLVELAENKLEFDRFVFYLKQDYHYLVNYAQMQCLAASKTSDYKEILKISKTVEEIAQEIERHKQKLLTEYSIDVEELQKDINGFIPSKACINYCNYLQDIGTKENFISSLVSLAPCLLGYYEAAIYGSKFRVHEGDSKISQVYGQWLGDYILDWYSEAYHRGIETLDDYFRKNPVSKNELDHLVEIFADVSQLEVEFWDEVLK